MKKTTLILSIIAVVCFGIIACKKNQDIPPDLGYNYFPNQAGRYVIYNVDSVFYEDANINPVTHIAKIDSFRFQLKEKIESVFLDNQNRPTLRLERYVRLPDTNMSYTNSTWQLRDVWMENRTTTTAEKVEENIRFIKLIFPAKEGQTWNGNAQNSLGEQDYYYDFIDKPRTIGTFNFDSVLNVSQLETLSLIGKQSYSEKYARNVGLVYKAKIDVQSQPPADSASATTFFAIPILQRVTGGSQYIMSLNSYGIE